MSKKHTTLLLVFSLLMIGLRAQEYRLRPGEVFDTIQVEGTSESYSIYLPKSFQQKGKWPLMLVFNLQGKAGTDLNQLIPAAEREGYLLAYSHQVRDSLSITDNVLITDRMIESLKSIFPVHLGRVYTYGKDVNARFANLVPVLLKDVAGVISDGSGLANQQLINAKNPFHFIGIVSSENFNYPLMLEDASRLRKLKFRNQLLLESAVSAQERELEHQQMIETALRMFQLAAMKDDYVARDSVLVEQSYQSASSQVQHLYSLGEAQRAVQWLETWTSVFKGIRPVEEWESQAKIWKKTKSYRTQKREEATAFFKENILKEDFIFYLQEDMEIANFNNLGWWNAQMSDLQGFISSPNKKRSEMGLRLKSFVNALVEDTIDLLQTEKEVKEFDNFLYIWMLKTLTSPEDSEAYLRVASLSSYREDFGTALFYLEELLKRGYKDRASLYELEDTALLRITPEFNALIGKYFKETRYEPK